MRMIKLNEINSVTGGYATMIAYPVLGCGINTAFTFVENPKATNKELGNSCLRGAIHGANPSLGIVGRITTNSAAKYGIGIVYGKYSSKLADMIIEPGPGRCSDSCSSADFLGGYND